MTNPSPTNLRLDPNVRMTYSAWDTFSRLDAWLDGRADDAAPVTPTELVVAMDEYSRAAAVDMSRQAFADYLGALLDWNKMGVPEQEQAS